MQIVTDARYVVEECDATSTYTLLGGLSTWLPNSFMLPQLACWQYQGITFVEAIHYSSTVQRYFAMQRSVTTASGLAGVVYVVDNSSTENMQQWFQLHEPH
jgi:hypothetical protein